MIPTSEVMAYCRAQHDNPQPPPPYDDRTWKGLCGVFTRSAFQVGPKYPSAASMWEHADQRHPVTTGDDVPRGVPVFWLGGSEGYGHAAVSAGGGLCWSTDWGGVGQVNLARIDQISTQWRLRLVGWSQDINDVPVWELTVPNTPRMDRIVELGRRARRATANPRKDADLDTIIQLARKWSTRY